MQDPTGEAASEAQKHLTLYELDLGLNHVVSHAGVVAGQGNAYRLPAWCFTALVALG